MNTQLGDTEKMPYTVMELDADSNPVPPQPGDTLAVVSSDTASATLLPDAAPTVAGALGTGFIVGGSKVQLGVQVTFTALRAGGTPIGSPLVANIDIVGGNASSVSVSFGTPVAQ